MVVTILAIVLGLVITAGGIVPNVANGMLQTRLNETLNQPEYLRVQVHPAAPSFSLLSGTIAYTEIDAHRFVISDFPVEELQVRIDKLQANTGGEQLSLREPTQGVVRLRVTEAGLNRFLQSDTFRQLLDDLRKRQELVAQLDADLNDLAIELQPDRLIFRGQAATMGGFFTIPFELSGQLRLSSERQLYVQGVQATTLDRPLPDDMIAAILTALNPVLDLTKLSNDDMQLYFREITVGDDYLELTGEAQLKKLPG
ncbi:MAG: hypothetical protein CVV27_16465 [Candidatus Melainabacteria bacterium HGW-Melainabacteria-1]|nr:MAG: hypothetical protein CVV27_16465 [Candidatus Melainabacteria bacterium HGW-Melainabacteria-1]